jgi:biopolymer transport protein ExbD
VKKEKKTFSEFINTDFFLIFRGFILILIFCSPGAVIEIASQTKREPPNKMIPPKPARTPSRPIEVLDASPTTELPKYAFVIEIDKSQKITIKIENINGSPFGGDSSVSLLSDFFTRMSNQDSNKILTFEGGGTPTVMEIEEKKPTSKKPASAKKQVEQKLSFADVIIKAYSDVSFASIIKVADAARKSTLQVKIKTSERDNAPFLYIPRMVLVDPNYSPLIKPNPLTLVVQLRSNGSLLLNMEEQGTIDDLSRLKNHLKGIFKERETNGVFRQGANEIETGIFIKASISTKFSEVIKIAEALNEAGASPIGLQIDDLPQ